MTDPHVICSCGHERQEHNEGGCGVLVGSWSDGVCPCREYAAGDDGEDGPLCGDPTCEDYACTQAALDAWHARQQEEARAIVRGLLLDPISEALLAQGPYIGNSASESSDG